MDSFAVDVEACRDRQERLREAIEPLNADLILLTRRESVQWLTGLHVKSPFEPIAAMTVDGSVTLVVPNHLLDDSVAADEVFGYDGKWHATNRDDQRSASSAELRPKLPRSPKQIACEFEAFAPTLLLDLNASLIEIDAILFELRRHKDADELKLMSRANDANRAMYERARQIVRPGLNELELFAELHRVAVKTLGEAPTYFGQDFRFGDSGGPPRNRAAQAVELLILDLGVGFRGYHSDNCRTIAVDGVSDEQERAWEVVADTFAILAGEIRPGMSCRYLYDLAHKHLNAHAPWTFDHHLGHGVGLAPHEGPHLNPRWDDILAEGDFIAVEPGVYHESLKGGVRVEQNYLITSTGAKLLSDWPLGLTTTV
ncbi:MAG TPA: Xaa-Pro peptidase family protein [Lacipirellulaceae bacterium]|nr:Xaa-Pro peptidase family protein [Lacipirellulaceae bacterium]